MAKKETIVIDDEYKGHKLFAIYEMQGEEEDGQGYEKSKPIVSFGLKKATAICDHVDELKEWVEKNA